MRNSKYTTSIHQPLWLSEDEIKNPYLVIRDFFDYAHLPQVRELLRESMRTTVCGTFCEKSVQERSEMLYFFEKIERLVEASQLIITRNKFKKY